MVVLDRAIEAAEQTDDRWYLAELYRKRGVLLLAGNNVDRAKGEAELEKSLAIARDQEAKIWELRTATSIARHCHATGRTPQARKLLQPVYAWFTEGLDSADIIAAKKLLADLKL